VSSAYVTLTLAPAPTDTARAFVTLTSTTSQDNGVVTLTVNAALSAIIRPRGQTIQRLMVRVTADLPAGRGAVFGHQIVSWETEETIDAGTSWTITMFAGDNLDHGFFGWPQDFGGAPPPGTGLVRLELLYVLLDGTTSPFTLFSGYSLESSQTLGVHRITLTGMGGAKPFDRATGVLSLPPKHGLTHGEVCRAILLAMGVPIAQIKVGADIGSPRTNPFDIPCAEGLQHARDVLEAAGYVLIETRDDPPVFDAEPRESSELGTIFGP
jgi:hypothetical protein